MERIDQIIRRLAVNALNELWNHSVDPEQLQVQKTRREFTGDFTLVVFPLVRYARLSPEETGKQLGQYMTAHSGMISGFNVIKGFLNLNVSL